MKCLIFLRKLEFEFRLFQKLKLLTIVPIVNLSLPCEATVLLMHLLEAVKDGVICMFKCAYLSLFLYSSERYLEHYWHCGLDEFK